MVKDTLGAVSTQLMVTRLPERIFPMKAKRHGPFRRKGVDEYVSRMTRPLDKAIYDSTVTSLLSKAGFDIPENPASIYEPKQLWEQLDRYCEEEVFEEDEFIQSAIRRAYRAFGFKENLACEKLSPLVTETEHLNAIKLEKHAGVFMSDKLAAWPRAWTRRQDVLDGIKRPNPCLAGARTQRGNKTRLVWMYPLEMTMLECQFASPLIENFKVLRTPMPYALRRHEIGSRLYYTLKERNQVALDFSKFDSSVPQELIRVAFRILKTWFNEFSAEQETAWKTVINYFINTPIVMIDGYLYSGKQHGVPSGSFFTQLVDSIVNYIIITAAMIKFDYKPHERRIHVLGDDSVFSTNMDVDLAELREYFLTKGFKLNIEKSAVTSRSEGVHFIGFDWINGVPKREVASAILSMTQPEKWRPRSSVFVEDKRRAFRLITEICSLGTNLYGVYNKVLDRPVREQLYSDPEWKASVGFQKFQLEHFPTSKHFFRNIASGIWI